MNREQLIKNAYRWIEDGACDAYNEPGEAMADFHIAMSAERDAEIADDIIHLHQNHKTNELFLRELSYFIHELKGGNATAHAMFDEMQEALGK